MKSSLTLSILLLFAGGVWAEEKFDKHITYDGFIRMVENGHVAKVEFVEFNDGRHTIRFEAKTIHKGDKKLYYETVRPPFAGDNLSGILSINNVPIGKVGEASSLKIFGYSMTALFGLFLIWIIPLILTVVVVFYVWRFLKKRVKD